MKTKTTRPGARLKPDRLTMRLFDPGMSILHRVGLGGLACTLKALEDRHRDQLIDDDQLPAPFVDGSPPWEVDEQSVTLKFGDPEAAAGYLRRLFAFTFTVRSDGLIYLPGQHEMEPSTAVLADLQTGLLLTFLQHGRVRNLAKEPTTATHDPEGEGSPGVIIEYRKCIDFKHQCAWVSLVDKKGRLVSGPVSVDGSICPGSAVRHGAYGGDTGIKDPPERVLPLYFALVGSLALSVNRGVGALIVPDVQDLTTFVDVRPAMTPTKATDCLVANAADAALRTQAHIHIRDRPARTAEVRSRARSAIGGSDVPACYAMTFMPTPWASQQKSRVATILVPPGEDRILDRYQRALSYLSPRIVTRTISESIGRGKQKTVAERRESFRADSIVRPLIADNLARGRPWYAGFVRLYTQLNPANGNPYRNQLPFERGGLHMLISDKEMWDDEGEELIVKAVHEAIRYSLGRIREETDGKDTNKPLSQATKNRWERFQETLRISLANAKNGNDARHTLCNLFSRAGQVPSLVEGWRQVLPKLADHRWQLTRDLALLALASYSGKNAGSKTTGDDTDSTSDN